MSFWKKQSEIVGLHDPNGDGNLHGITVNGSYRHVGRIGEGMPLQIINNNDHAIVIYERQKILYTFSNSSIRQI